MRKIIIVSAILTTVLLLLTGLNVLSVGASYILAVSIILGVFQFLGGRGND